MSSRYIFNPKSFFKWEVNHLKSQQLDFDADTIWNHPTNELPIRVCIVKEIKDKTMKEKKI